MTQDKKPPRNPERFNRSFAADESDRLWAADITYIPMRAGFLYLAIVLDAFSRRIVGWSMADHLRTELVLDAIELAVGQRKPQNVIHHSDQGSQYTSLAFGSRCREAGVRPSMGSVGDAYDNAMAESFFSTLECELLARRRFHSRPEARMALFSYLEGFYNPVRRHSALGYRSPLVYEQEHSPKPATKILLSQAPQPSTATGQSQANRLTRITQGADKGDDAADFVNELRAMAVTPHVACNTAGRRSAIDGRTTRQPGYAISQTIRKRIEESFGWSKEIGLIGRFRVRGRERIDMAFTVTAAAFNLARLPKLLGTGATA